MNDSIIVVLGAAGIAGQALVDTPNGPRAASSLEAGDLITDETGETAQLVGVIALQENPQLEKFVEINLDDGSVILVGKQIRVDGRPAGEIAPGDVLGGEKTVLATRVRGGVAQSFEFFPREIRVAGVRVHSEFFTVARDFAALDLARDIIFGDESGKRGGVH